MVVNFRARGISRGTRKLACKLGVSTKIEKPIKPGKKTKKTKLNPNRKKPEPNWKNQAKTEKTKSN